MTLKRKAEDKRSVVENWQLQQRQGLSIEAKIILTEKRIKEFYSEFEGNVYVAFSGGKDSTVLLHIVRSIYPHIKAVFIDTGLEHIGNRKLVDKTDNVEIIRPKKSFMKVVEEYGYPVISKSVSMAISRYRNTKDPIQKELRLNGGINPTSGKKQSIGIIPKKWHKLIDAPFKISERCCDILKKEPVKIYEKETGLHPYLGSMASDSHTRKIQYLKYGCNALNKQSPSSTPLGFWTEQDILKYILKFNVSYSVAYGNIVNGCGVLSTTKEERTGCQFCLFGVHMEKTPNRFQRMKSENPRMYDFCIYKLGIGKVLNFIGVEA